MMSGLWSQQSQILQSPLMKLHISYHFSCSIISALNFSRQGGQDEKQQSRWSGVICAIQIPSPLASSFKKTTTFLSYSAQWQICGGLLLSSRLEGHDFHKLCPFAPDRGCSYSCIIILVIVAASIHLPCTEVHRTNINTGITPGILLKVNNTNDPGLLLHSSSL